MTGVADYIARGTGILESVMDDSGVINGITTRTGHVASRLGFVASGIGVMDGNVRVSLDVAVLR